MPCIHERLGTECLVLFINYSQDSALLILQKLSLLSAKVEHFLVGLSLEIE